MESPVKPCHLLRISRELRDCIYDHVIHFDPPTDTVGEYKNNWRKARYSTQIVKTPGTNFSIPWVDLLLTCNAIKIEITAYLDVLSKVDNNEHRTWTIDLAVYDGLLKPAQWRQIPCHPIKVKFLVANLDFNENFLFWGDGGPRPIVRQLYQTLNRILHYGPVFGKQVLLSQHLRLDMLVLRVTRGISDQ